MLLTNPFFPPKHFCSIHIHSQFAKVYSAYSNSCLSTGIYCLLPWEFLTSQHALLPRTGHEDFEILTHRLVNRLIFSFISKVTDKQSDCWKNSLILKISQFRSENLKSEIFSHCWLKATPGILSATGYFCRIKNLCPLLFLHEILC